MTVVVHSFVADSSLLDCCDLVVFFCCLFLGGSTLCLQVGNHLGFGGGFSCFVSFIWCQLFGWLIWAAIFHLPPAFVVWSFFLCHRHLWSVLSFFATGICHFVYGLFLSWPFLPYAFVLRLFVFALLALVSEYQGISQFLVSCCVLAAHQLHPWRFKLYFFASRLPCGQPYKFRFEANHNWYSAIKFTKSYSLHKWVWLRCSIKVSLFKLYKFDPFSPPSRLIPQELMHSYALGCLWVVTICCNTVGRHDRAFCWPHAYTFNEQSKMATALTPHTDVTSEKVTWLMPVIENPRQQSQPAYRK